MTQTPAVYSATLDQATRDAVMFAIGYADSKLVLMYGAERWLGMLAGLIEQLGPPSIPEDPGRCA